MQEFSTMVADLRKDGQVIINTITPIEIDMLHMAVGAAGEFSELSEPIVEYSEGRSELDTVNVREELGDIEFFLEGLRQCAGIERDDTLSLVGNYHEGSLSVEPSKDILGFACYRLSVEGGHLLDVVKRAAIYKKPFDKNKLTVVLSACEAILAVIRNQLTITRDATLQGNLNKLLKGDNARYKSGVYSDEQAQNRKDKQQEQAA